MIHAIVNTKKLWLPSKELQKTKHEVNQEGPVGRKGGVVEFTGGKETVIYFVLGTAHRL